MPVAVFEPTIPMFYQSISALHHMITGNGSQFNSL